jgi:hypothetical protein
LGFSLSIENSFYLLFSVLFITSTMNPLEVSVLTPSLQEIKSTKEARALLFALDKFMQSQRIASIGLKAAHLYLACGLVYEKHGLLGSSSMPKLSFVLDGAGYLVSNSLGSPIHEILGT